MRRLLAAFGTLVMAAGLLVAVPAASADTIRDLEYWLDGYGVRAAWNTTRGAGVTVAVIDTGIDGTHPDLVGQVAGGTDVSGVGASNGQKPVGESSHHGTMVASLLAGRGHGDGRTAGIVGVAPEATLLSVSIGFGVGSIPSDDQIAQGVRWAVDNGADIINMSLTRNTLDWPTSWDDAFLYAMEHDVIIVAAAGNRGSGTTEVGAPATMPGVVVVAGVDRNGRASFNASSQGITITVSAPSEELVGAVPGGGYYSWQGTSGATPIVAGVLALIRSAHPDLDAGNVINRLVKTANAVGTELPNPSYGYGLVNAAAAVSATVAAVEASPAGELQEWIRVHRRGDGGPAPEVTSPPVKPAPTPTPRVEAVSPLGSVLPSPALLRDVGIPLLLYLTLIVALGLWIRGFLTRSRK